MTTSSSIHLEPLGGLPIWLILVMLALFSLALWWRQSRDSWLWRILALAGIGLFLLNPQKIDEIRQPLADIVGIVIDESQSMDMTGRASLRQQISEKLRERLSDLDNTEIRVLRYRDQQETDSETGAISQTGTRLVEATAALYEDVSRDRIAATFLVTDGQIHDVPGEDQTIPPWADAPVHVLLAGQKKERDRKLVLEKAPRYGLIGKNVEYRFIVQDTGSSPDMPETAKVLIESDDHAPRSMTVPVNTPITLEAKIRHGNQNHIILTAEPLTGANGDQELSLVNNQAILTINGIRNRLKVLLISGQPYAGERVWRNLLKGDPSVDLVHFTILRPLNKRDEALDKEVSLIGFPVRQLFDQTVDDFDLILFDRYRRHGVIAPAYFRNIADYVRKGGSLMIAAGPDFASPLSITRTPLDDIIPVAATGNILEKPFRPTLTRDGRRHPVTANLAANKEAEKAWADWHRLIATSTRRGRTLMDDQEGNPLLVVDRVEKGRIAVLLSDHAWIWARGIDGGGPHTELLRRTAHWLMQEPELEEERLSAKLARGRLQIERNSMKDGVQNATITQPDGVEITRRLTDIRNGISGAELPAPQQGMYKIRVGDKITSVAAGNLNPRELTDLIASGVKTAPLTDQSGGGHWFVGNTGLPDIKRMDAESSSFASASTAGLRDTQSARITGTTRAPMLPGWLITLWTGFFLFFAWYRESHGGPLFRRST